MSAWLCQHGKLYGLDCDGCESNKAQTMTPPTNIPTPRTEKAKVYMAGINAKPYVLAERMAELERENVVLRGAITFPKLTSGNLEAIVYHLRQGEDNGGITRDALAKFLELVKDKLIKYTEALIPPTMI